MLSCLCTGNRESDGKTMLMCHIPVSHIYHHPCSVTIEYNYNASLFKNFLLSHATRIQQRIKYSSCLPKGFAPCYVVHCFVAFLLVLVLIGKRELIALFVCLHGVLWLLLFCCSSSRCRGLVCNVWLWYFLITLACFKKNNKKQTKVSMYIIVSYMTFWHK